MLMLMGRPPSNLTAGFTLDNNPDDALMIMCPPPETEQAAFAAKLRILQSQGLTPQLFLSLADLKEAEDNQLRPFLLASSSVLVLLVSARLVVCMQSVQLTGFGVAVTKLFRKSCVFVVTSLST